MRFRFLPQQARFFDEFTAMAGRVQDGARLLRGMLGGAAPDYAKAEEIRVVEHDCDERTRQIVQRLNTTFVTPLDREDIHALARTLDDVMDAIDAAATLFPLYEIAHRAARRRRAGGDHRPAGRPVAGRHRGAGEAHRRAGAHPRDPHPRARGRPDAPRGGCRTSSARNATPSAVIKWKEILDLLEAATDAAESVADVLEGIVLKHS